MTEFSKALHKALQAMTAERDALALELAQIKGLLNKQEDRDKETGAGRLDWIKGLIQGQEPNALTRKYSSE